MFFFFLLSLNTQLEKGPSSLSLPKPEGFGESGEGTELQEMKIKNPFHAQITL